MLSDAARLRVKRPTGNTGVEGSECLFLRESRLEDNGDMLVGDLGNPLFRLRLLERMSLEEDMAATTST
jgi:hypothetical protein